MVFWIIISSCVTILSPVGQSVNITIKAKTTKTGSFTNVVSVYCAENDTVVSDNVTVNVYEPDLKIAKTANATSVLVNDLVNFTVVVRNHGDSFATNVRISGILPDEFEFVSAGGNYSRNGQTVVWTIDKLDAEQDFTVWIVVCVKDNGTFDNVACVNCTEEPAVKNSTATVEAVMPSLNVTKLSIEKFVYSGNEASFKIIITNNGIIELNNMFVNEIIPEGLIYSRFVGSNWTNNGNMFYYNGSLGVGESVELIVIVNTTKSGNFINNIIAGADNINNQTANANVTVYTPSLFVREISNDPIVVLGNQVSFTVVITNDGDCALGEVYVSNIFPEGFVYTGFEGENWTKVGDRFVYSGVLNQGESISYILYFNTAVSGVFVPEVIAGSNLTSNATSKAYSNNTTVVVAPNIDLSKVVDKTPVNVSDLVTFTITVLNSGSAVLNDIFVVDNIPEGLKFVSFDGDGWSKEGNNYYCSGSLAPGESVNFTIICEAIEVCNVTNVATVFSDRVGNVSAEAAVSVVNNTEPGPEPGPEPQPKPVNPVEPETHEPVHVSTDSKATGNPIMLLLLIILAFVPLRRRRN